jgi:hypothetical protein
MQQRQLRLGDILDDYCPRERRVTNHVIVAMIGDEVKQTRCTTCDADHEYKHAKVPRQRRKTETPAVLYSQVAATAPKRVVHEHHQDDPLDADAHEPESEQPLDEREAAAASDEAVPVAEPAPEEPQSDAPEAEREESGDVFMHRPLIRAQLPRHEGQPARERQAPDFTIRQPAGRPGRFRPRNPRGGGQPFGGNGNRGSSNGNGNFGQSMRGGAPRQHGGRPNGGGNSPFRPGRNQGPGPGRKRSR